MRAFVLRRQIDGRSWDWIAVRGIRAAHALKRDGWQMCGRGRISDFVGA